MHHDILDVIKNIDELYENNTSLAVLKDFERVLDQMDMYVYENWEDGELAYGPKVDRHWITAGFMWEDKKMPNPSAAKRLTEMGCKVSYQKSHLLEPRKIKKPSDIRPGTKKGKLDRKPIWIVEIQMPKQVAFDIYRGYMDKMKAESAGTEAPSTKAPQASAITSGPMPASNQGAAPMGGAPTAPTAGSAPAPTV
jgi:hypothetical protein